MAYKRVTLESPEGELEKLRVSLVRKYGDELGNALFYYLKDTARVLPESELGKPNPTRRALARALVFASGGTSRNRELAEEAWLEVMEYLCHPHPAIEAYHNHDL